MTTYELVAQITPGTRLGLRVPVPQSTPPDHYADLLASQLSPDLLSEANPKELHLFTVTIEEREVEVAIVADSMEVAAKIICARCYNIIKTDAVRNTVI